MCKFNTQMKPGTAILSNEGNMTIFHYGDQRIKFRSPNCLECYIEVKHWDMGYIVVMAQYTGIGIEEEYIDLMPILNNLYIEPDRFLSSIKSIVIV